MPNASHGALRHPVKEIPLPSSGGLNGKGKGIHPGGMRLPQPPGNDTPGKAKLRGKLHAVEDGVTAMMIVHNDDGAFSRLRNPINAINPRFQFVILV